MISRSHIGLALLQKELGSTSGQECGMGHTLRGEPIQEEWGKAKKPKT
jgi:hypothetical protein